MLIESYPGLHVSALFTDTAECHASTSLPALLLPLLPSQHGAEVPWLELQQLLLIFTFTTVQLHHVPTPRVVKGGRHSSPAIQVLPTGAGDHHVLAEERALGADFLVKLLQVLDCWGASVCCRQRVQPPGLLVVLVDDPTKLVARA